MPVIERKVSFGDPSAIRFKDTVIVPKILEIDVPGDVWVESSTFVVDDCRTVGLPLSHTEVTAWHSDWEEIGFAPKEDWRRIREIILYYLGNFELEDIDDLLEDETPIGLEEGRFAIGPAVKIDEERNPVFLKNSVGIWYEYPRYFQPYI